MKAHDRGISDKNDDGLIQKKETKKKTKSANKKTVKAKKVSKK